MCARLGTPGGNWELACPHFPISVTLWFLLSLCKGLRALIEKHPLFLFSPPGAAFSSWDGKMLVCV